MKTYQNWKIKLLMKNKKILLVDDEENLINVVNLWLIKAGYETTLCYSTEEATTNILNNEYDLIFSDVIMPGKINGFDLVEFALQNQPNIKVLLASGYTGGIEEKRNLDVEVLAKPYRKQFLLAKIQVVLEQP